MSFADSYLGRLREKVGHDLVLMPGASVVVVREDGQVLFGHRIDMDLWSLIGGSAEIGGSFGRTAVNEIREEAGLTVAEADLLAFATYSEAETHRVDYPNGDQLHGFTVCFAVRRWQGEPHADGAEMREVRFADPASPPGPLHDTAVHVLAFWAAYLETGRFQTR